MRRSQERDRRPTRYFRAGAGAVITNSRGRLLVFERADRPGAWQFPQGGLKSHETWREAIDREIREETGLVSGDLRLLTEYPEPLVYELPARAQSLKTGIGQVQRWFYFQLVNDDVEPPIPVDSEFRRWRWTSFDAVVRSVVAFRRPLYRRLRSHFRTVPRLERRSPIMRAHRAR
jgi:putative (di)nucleoside polyphosphate hydrolase